MSTESFIISPVTRSLLLAPLLLLGLAALTLLPRPSPVPVLDPEHPALAAPIDPVAHPLAAAERARGSGDLDAAALAYRALLQHSDREVVEEARARLAGIEFARGRYDEATAVIEPIAASTTPLLRDRAAFLFAEIARAKKDCPGALPRYRSLVESKALLEPYARLGLMTCARGANEVVREAQALLATDPHRRLRIEVLERLAAAELQRGNPARYFEIYDELFSMGATRSYRGTVLFSAAEAARKAGNDAMLVDRLSRLVREYPEHPKAPVALDMLNALQRSDAMSWTQAALVRLHARETEAAKDGFEVALAEAPDGPEAAVARYHLASLALREGRESEAAREMRDAAVQQPESVIATTALLRAGRIFESNDELDAAQESFTLLATRYPETSAGRQGRFRLGLVHYLRGQKADANAVWDSLATDSAERDLQAMALLWQGKTYRELGRAAEGDARLQRAVEVGPDTFAGYRAQAILRGDTRSLHTFQPWTLPRGVDGAPDPTLDAWLEAQGSSRAELTKLATSEPLYLRAQELSRLGLREQASWEFDGLSAQATASETPGARHYLVAATQMSLGHTALALRTAEASVRELGVPRTTLPNAYLRLLMPLAFEEPLIEGANRHGADALLFAALVRQESRWEPQARSSANALGLSQIVPGTGRTIANALGKEAFTESDLLKPELNLEFGAYYLAGQLKRYGGLILPALAAYNAGGGAVDRWLNAYGRTDMDLFAARVPYSETSYYLNVVFENYQLYRRAYGRE